MSGWKQVEIDLNEMKAYGVSLELAALLHVTNADRAKLFALHGAAKSGKPFIQWDGDLLRWPHSEGSWLILHTNSQTSAATLDAHRWLAARLSPPMECFRLGTLKENERPTPENMPLRLVPWEEDNGLTASHYH